MKAPQPLVTSHQVATSSPPQVLMQLSWSGRVTLMRSRPSLLTPPLVLLELGPEVRLPLSLEPHLSQPLRGLIDHQLGPPARRCRQHLLIKHHLQLGALLHMLDRLAMTMELLVDDLALQVLELLALARSSP